MTMTQQDMTRFSELVSDVIEQRLEPKFAKIDARFDGLDTRLDGIDVRLDGIDVRLDGIDSRLGRVEEDVTVIKDIVKDHSYDIAALKHKTA